ncbi:MAG: alpha/beta fold hydrolase [candidate division Zixibacteria bacterium]
MKTYILLLALIFASASRVSGQAVEPKFEQFTTTSADSLILHGWGLLSNEETNLLVVMLPMMGNTHESYGIYADSINGGLVGAIHDYCSADSGHAARPHILALDLRGHGESTARNSEKLDYRSMSKDQFALMPSDVATIVNDFRKEHGEQLDSVEVVMIGASIGANSAIMATTNVPRVSKVALLSPGSDYRGLKPAGAFSSFDGNILLMTSRGDSYSFESCQSLARLKPTGWLLKAYPGGDHGTNLIHSDERAMHYLVNWIFGLER